MDSTSSQQEDFTSLYVLAETIRHLESARTHREEQEDKRREQERREKRRAARQAKKDQGNEIGHRLEMLIPPLADAEFRGRLSRLPGSGRRLLLWVLEQQEIERDIQADDDLSRNADAREDRREQKAPGRRAVGAGGDRHPRGAGGWRCSP